MTTLFPTLPRDRKGEPWFPESPPPVSRRLGLFVCGAVGDLVSLLVMAAAVAMETDDAGNRLRFQLELEFVQCLANPNYLNFLAQRGYFKDKAFVNYLKYLLYWKEPEYAKYLKSFQWPSIKECSESGEQVFSEGGNQKAIVKV
ncbi:PREDICTED: mediator of RNA polymerase II transcription subunit 31 isoform X2 [Chinchilla lanigera]|uniref:mediator of RNA polymerase II transcription subunit 31 isoform X2 n=1 Tax=Chinchilla lanigera TaxID=34839 RepID=UPI0006989CEE|nr:PREDICTED: mediator of RNA polymerase II transcription subunit 31 isoform X2 [Chinchilla lanigera]